MGRTILANVDGFTPVIDQVVKETGNPITSLVFGRIWRFCQMKDGVCQASMETIGKALGMSRSTIFDHVKILVNKGYIKDCTPDLRNHPHTYADTGKAGLQVGVSAETGVRLADSLENEMSVEDTGVRQAEATVRQAEATVRHSNMKIDIKKDFKKQIRARNFSKPILGIEPAIRQGRPVTEEDVRSSNLSWGGRESMPEPIRDLLDTYVQLTGQRPAKNQLMDWLQAGQEWLEIGITASDLRLAYSKAKPDNGSGFSVARPGSLTNVAGMFAGERRKTAKPISVLDRIAADIREANQ